MRQPFANLLLNARRDITVYNRAMSDQLPFKHISSLAQSLNRRKALTWAPCCGNYFSKSISLVHIRAQELTELPNRQLVPTACAGARRSGWRQHSAAHSRPCARKRPCFGFSTGPHSTHVMKLNCKFPPLSDSNFLLCSLPAQVTEPH